MTTGTDAPNPVVVWPRQYIYDVYEQAMPTIYNAQDIFDYIDQCRIRRWDISGYKVFNAA
jgi:hypothetical protein